MITYEYKCSCCQNQIEVQQSIKEKPLTKCEACGQHKLERQMSGGLYGSVRQDATCLGQQAERNAKKFGKNKCQELDAENAKRAYQRDPQQEKMSKILAGGQDRVERYIRTGK